MPLAKHIGAAQKSSCQARAAGDPGGSRRRVGHDASFVWMIWENPGVKPKNNGWSIRRLSFYGHFNRGNSDSTRFAETQGASVSLQGPSDLSLPKGNPWHLSTRFVWTSGPGSSTDSLELQFPGCEEN